MTSLSEISSSATGDEKPPLMPTDQGFPENNPWPHTDVANSAPVLSASATKSCSASENRAAAAEDERPLRAHQRVGEAFDGARIGMQPPGRRRQFERRQVRGKRRVLHVERHAEDFVLAITQSSGDGAQHVFAAEPGVRSRSDTAPTARTISPCSI